MILLFKISGLVFVISSGWILGFLKSADLKKKSDKLLKISENLNRLSQKIEMGCGEINDVIFSVFSNDEISLKDGNYYYCGNDIKQKYRETVNELLSLIGTGNRESECKRIEMYSNLLFNGYKEEIAEYKSKSKIYRMFGLCIGISVVVFLM